MMTYKNLIRLLFLVLIPGLCAAQVTIPVYYEQDAEFDQALREIIHNEDMDATFDVGEDGEEQISFAVIDLTSGTPVLGGWNMDNFIYPASVYKMYVAMEVLSQVSKGAIHLDDQYIVHSPNDVDRSVEIATDPRPLLADGDTVTINYLLDLMITRSDNSAANCLIDVADRSNINKTMIQNGWKGSEVTRKFLGRKWEDPGYDTIRGTMTSAIHAVDFMYKIETNQLMNPWVSMQLKALLGRQLDHGKLAAGLPETAMYYHKTGWWSYYTNDVGIVDDGRLRYIIALFTPLEEEKVSPRMANISDKVYRLISSRHPGNR